jgi:16S rRNA (uracil1498-N3)-methyltransferase
LLMSDRYYSATPIAGTRITLDDSEAHHLLHVMRAAVNNQVTVFDGSGAEFTAVVEKLGRSAVDLKIVARHEVSRELPFTLTVGVSLPKGDRQKWLVEKLTELGVNALVPVITDRGVAQPTVAAIERLKRTVIEASKQCGRNLLMQIADPQRWNQWIAPVGVANQEPLERRLVAHPGGTALSQVDISTPVRTQLAVGPEGGLTDAEIEIAVGAGWQMVELGARILRVDTAAVALCAAISLLNPPLTPP